MLNTQNIMRYFTVVAALGLCPGVPVHRGNNYCTPLFTSLCLAIAYCWVYCIGSCVPVHEDRTRARIAIRLIYYWKSPC